MRLKGLVGVMILVAGVTGFAPATLAQEQQRFNLTRDGQRLTVQDAFWEAYYRNGRDIFRNRSIGGQVNLILGPGSIIRNSFTENVIARDAELVNSVYNDVFDRQTLSDPTIRTVDLPNPFDTSVLLLPAGRAGSQPLGGELILETAPR